MTRPRALFKVEEVRGTTVVDVSFFQSKAKAKRLRDAAKEMIESSVLFDGTTMIVRRGPDHKCGETGATRHTYEHFMQRVTGVCVEGYRFKSSDARVISIESMHLDDDVP